MTKLTGCKGRNNKSLYRFESFPLLVFQFKGLFRFYQRSFVSLFMALLHTPKTDPITAVSWSTDSYCPQFRSGFTLFCPICGVQFWTKLAYTSNVCPGAYAVFKYTSNGVRITAGLTTVLAASSDLQFFWTCTETMFFFYQGGWGHDPPYSSSNLQVLVAFVGWGWLASGMKIDAACSRALLFLRFLFNVHSRSGAMYSGSAASCFDRWGVTLLTPHSHRVEVWQTRTSESSRGTLWSDHCRVKTKTEFKIPNEPLCWTGLKSISRQPMSDVRTLWYRQ